ncbi:MAG: hypothetical protein Q9191_002501 [Dirinaria sp. TL-2023a]
MNGGPSIIRRPASEKSNVELINSLRSTFLASKQAFSTTKTDAGTTSAVEISKAENIPYSAWTRYEDNTLFVPSIDFTQTGLAEERSQYDITVKLFFLPSTSSAERCKHAREAVDLVLKELHMDSIDLLIVSFPGVSFDADDEDEDEDEDSQGGEGEDLEAMVQTWKALEYLHSQGIAKQIGVAEFGKERLERFLPGTLVRPSVDQINVKDCCVVPKSLILYAKSEKIELLTHNDCTNILPRGTVRDLLGSGEKGSGVLAGPEDEINGLRGDVAPQWVVKYTAVVRDRGVIEYKGYFAMAEIQD